MPDRRRLSRVRRSLVGVAVILGWVSASLAAEPSVRVRDGVSMADYAARVDRVSDRVLRDAAAARNGVGRGSLNYFDLNKPLGEVAGFDGLPAADRVLMRGAKQTYDLFRALGGPRVDSFAVAATETGRYYLSLDGEGGRWLATPGAALTMLARQLAEASSTPAQSARGGACPHDFRCLLKSVYQDRVPTIATVPRGTTVTLEIKGSGFSDKGGAPVIIAPEGITPHDVTVLDPETIKARVSVDADATTGRQTILAFDPGKQFNGRRYPVLVVENPDALEYALTGNPTEDGTNQPTGQAPPQIDDFADAMDKAAPLETGLAGRLDYAGDADLFRIDLAKGGGLSISSDGPTDLVGELMNAKGKLIAVDDDGGPRYNFGLAAQLPPGTYYLRVRHCCSGKGSYVLKRTTGAD